MKKYNAYQIKLFMAILMVFDHLPYIEGLVPIQFIGPVHVITRCVGVWFAYMAVEGFVHTHNRAKYNVRLFFWAGIMFLGNLAVKALTGVAISNNIFLTLAVGVLGLNIITYGKNKSKISLLYKIPALLILGVFSFGFAEGGHVIYPFILITYLLKNKLKLRNIFYLALSILLFYISYVPYETIETTINMLLFNCDFMFLLVLPFLYLYNGERGRNDKFSKYFFYVFYPAHLWLIAIVVAIVK